MATPITPRFIATDLDAIATHGGRIVVIVSEPGKLDPAARRVNKLMRGALARFASSERFEKMKEGEAAELAWPTGLAAEAVQVLRLSKRSKGNAMRKAGAVIGKSLLGKEVLVLAGNRRFADELALGACLRAYEFVDHMSKDAQEGGALTVMVSKPETFDGKAELAAALTDGVFFTRDLVNEPSNILTTTEFADRLVALKELGVEVSVLDEPELEQLGMRALLGVGQGSESPSKVVVMKWNGGEKDAAPLALIGKGVVFDTGGISLKPAAGMEDMTMDMGGAGTVAGAMKAISGRKAKANVVGVVGLVENMPDGRAQRPGDIVTSMKGDTIEVINTDAEGRLVLCDIMWYAQETFSPMGMIDLATLTGAIIIGLGHENTGVFSNDDPLCNAMLKAAQSEGEGAWRMPLGDAYDKLLKSNKADMKNVGGRAAGSITAAQFLQRFVKEGTPWIHLDIAGTAQTAGDTTYAPKGATGWGVLALNRLVSDLFEG
ncbi:leucyl aminopeptidase [Aliiroseovarius crassostreae]|uniref:Probable cytosol aminopeptidase n=1 Tax=Aliiroseovarius crassostreae TaxID=154981 RepID=A0A0N8IB23_9RHOB|nr:leucyl aminopeptidase [Aliiroseovarius crassostreae]KPN61907.1 aminopeptidase [Aliiroseovarius crassostreae]SFU69727.1 leucyl aminopeptidase [Aliiroseovarius crassostreae]